MESLKVTEGNYEAAATRSASILLEGGIVLYPTDTVYGLAVDATNGDALRNLAALKGREAGKTPLIVVPDIDAISTYARTTPPALEMTERFLPGPLTLVLAALPGVCREVVREDGSIGIRIPDDPFCRALSTAFPRPYTSTSANLAGEVTLGTITEILEQFGERASAIALAIDDGPREGGSPSTIVSFMHEQPEVLREGAISKDELTSLRS